MSDKNFITPAQNVHFPSLEEANLHFWEEQDIFQKTLEKNIHKQKNFNMYDGPPFATGLPHYGHILVSILKDVFPRYWTMNGFNVPRRFGWDCHGLPVEQEVNQQLALSSREAIKALGIANYNDACKKIVTRYTKEWKSTMRRIGRFVDMEKAYYTMDHSFMQSVWWVFSQLWQKGLIYEGYKVVPFSTGLATALSNFEANSNYKSTQDPAITIGFRVHNMPVPTFLLAWTTTPWSIPGNCACAVAPQGEYVIAHGSFGQRYILAKACVDKTFTGTQENITLTEHLSIETLLTLTYEPIFDIYAQQVKTYRVLPSDHVMIDAAHEGTGIVHIAPAFGEDDFYLGQRHDLPLVCPLDDNGVFTALLPEIEGLKAKEADKIMIRLLKQKGALIKHTTIEHSYPFCWRTDTPLIYKAVTSWFVAVEKIKEDLLAINEQIHWMPESLKYGRVGHWLQNARDWAISRNRFWGTPIPIWKNDEGEILCMGSIAELEALTHEKIHDLHIHHIDHLEIPSPTGKSPLRRVEGVLDCWFESGSMPYAQWGYPSEAAAPSLEKVFPADLITEGLDQTRGWFYTLMVLSAALFQKPPFRHVIVTGLILAEDGKKMSKRLKNYPDPHTVLSQHGADALRLYLLQSPVIKAQELRFSETGVFEVVRKILLRWWNAYTFFITYANIDHFKPGTLNPQQSPNILDQWILSRIHGLITNTQKHMQRYQLAEVIQSLLLMIEDLTNTYIRLNRKHFWQNGMPQDKVYAFETFYQVLLYLTKIMAPFTPFITETMYQNLALFEKNAFTSVHLADYPEARSEMLQPELEKEVQMMSEVLFLVRNFRDEARIKTKIPLQSITIIHHDPNVLDALKKFELYLKEECHLLEIHYTSHTANYLKLRCKPNFPVLGKKVGKHMKMIAQHLDSMSETALKAFQTQGTYTIDTINRITLTLEDVFITTEALPQAKHLQFSSCITLDINSEITQEQLEVGMSREVIRKIQAARKAAGLNLEDRISVELELSPALKEAVQKHLSTLKEETLTQHFEWKEAPEGAFTTSIDLDGEYIHIGISKYKP